MQQTNRYLTIRERRLALDLTAARLAALADCSRASLGYAEQGCPPKRSAALDRVLEILDRLEGRTLAAA